MKQIIISFDLFGEEVYLLHNNRRKIKSTFGPIISLLAIIIFTIFVWDFTGIFFNRTSPSFFKSEVDPPLLNLKNLTNDKFIFAFRFENEKSMIVDESGSSFYFKIYNNKYKKQNGIWNLDKKIELTYSKCNKLKFTNLISIFNNNKMHDYFCVDYDMNEVIEIGGNYDYMYYLEIEYKLCKENSHNSYSNIVCKPKYLTDKIIQESVYVSFLLQEIGVNPDNYENPLCKKISNYYYYIDSLISKISSIYLKEYIVISDVGWLFKNYVETSEIGYTNSYADMKSRQTDENNNNSDILGKAQIYMMNKKDKFSRTYTKFPYLISYFGGILYTISFILSFLVKKINRFKLDYELTKSEPILKNFKKNFKVSNNLLNNNKSNIIKDNVEISRKPRFNLPNHTSIGIGIRINNNLSKPNESKLVLNNNKNKILRNTTLNVNDNECVIKNEENKTVDPNQTSEYPFLNSLNSYIKFKLFYFFYSQKINKNYDKFANIRKNSLNIKGIIELQEKIKLLKETVDRSKFL